VADHVDHNQLLAMKHLIDDTVIAHAKFIKSREVTHQRFKVDVIDVRNQPIDAFNNATTDWFIQPSLLSYRRIQDADTIYAYQCRPRRHATDWSRSPRCPKLTAFFWRRSLSRTDFLRTTPESGSPISSINFRSTDASMIASNSLFVIRDKVVGM
jgi:hypothetical protein